MGDIDTSLLEAVNTMLSLIGEAPVNSLENAGSADVALAFRTLDEQYRQLQGRGWHWNTDRDITIEPDSQGRFEWETDWIRFDTPIGKYTNVDVVRRGDFLWNLAKSTDVFTQLTLEGEVVRFIDWSDMPERARNYVMVRAARIFLNRTMGDEVRSGYAAEDERRAWHALLESETDQADFNFQSRGTPRLIRRRVGSAFPFAF